MTEARTVANVDHPHIVPVFDVGSSDRFPCFVVSKYIDGTDLATRLKQSRPSIHETAEMVATVADALHHAHKHGLGIGNTSWAFAWHCVPSDDSRRLGLSQALRGDVAREHVLPKTRKVNAAKLIVNGGTADIGVRAYSGLVGREEKSGFSPIHKPPPPRAATL